ncbi:MAG: flagellar brake protein [Gammaproteobacteria bacterium]|nr:flagellar brake protein [Gammaproteobacteria bacterium]
MDLAGEFHALVRRASAPPERLVVDPREARHLLLKRIFDAHCLLDVRLGDDDTPYQSAIIELVPEQGYLVMDALTPADGNALAATLPAVRVRARLSGMELRFASRIQSSGSESGLAYFMLRYPDSVDYPQRRREYRVMVPLDRGLPVRFQTANGGWVRGEIRDLSPNGFCARILSGDVAHFEADCEELAHCVIDLPGQEPLTAMVSVRHLLPSKARTAPRVGACFVDLELRGQRMLERCLADIERHRLRPS